MIGKLKWDRVALGGVLVFMGVVLAWNMGAYAGGADSAGYLNFARLLRSGTTTEAQRCIEGLPPGALPPFAYVPLGLLPHEETGLMPLYPPGLPLLIAASSWVSGPVRAPDFAMWLHAMAGLLLFYGFSRQSGLGRWWSVAGMGLLGGGCLYLFISLQLMSDMPAMVWALAAVASAWQSRTSTRWSVAAGCAMAVAVLIRPSNMLLLIPIGVALGLDWRRWLGLALGGLPGAALLAVINHSLYGKVYLSGYGSVWELFSTDCVRPSLANYALWLPVELTPLVLLAPLAPWICRRELSTSRWLVFGLWILSYLGFYAFYPFTSETWWYLRFVLPAFPPLLVLSLLSARRLTMRFQGAGLNWAAGLLVLLCAYWSTVWTGRLHALKAGRGEGAYPEACDMVGVQAPRDAVIVSVQTSGALHYYTGHIIIRYDSMREGAWERVVAASRAAGRPVYALLFPHELPELDKGSVPGHWVKAGSARHITLWRLESL